MDYKFGKPAPIGTDIKDVSQYDSDITATVTDARDESLYATLCDLKRRLKTFEEKLDEACRMAKRDAA
jgi:hypothetical protein